MKSLRTTIITVLLFSLAAVFFFSGCSRSSKASPERLKEVVVYTYDSFISEWGPGPALIEAFEKQSGYTLTFVSVGDGGQVLSHAVLEKDNPQADVLVGLDNQLVEEARKRGILTAYKPLHADTLIPEHLRLADDWLLTPYDWSNFALIYDTQSSVREPLSLEDLTKEEYAKKIILMDPRTSTPGLGFVSWTVSVFGDNYLDYWKRLKPNILTMAPGWDTGYGLFTSGEAPLVISYTTSPAYHVEYEDTLRYKALIFAEGHAYQIEGAGVVNNALNEKGAKAFMDFLISKEAQDLIPLLQWMYPVNSEVILPPSFDAAPKAGKNLSADPQKVLDASQKIMNMLSQ
ncbi:MAG TPA: thiamine ABC transporter substrate-binding protein [Treponemataceae bacterium]|jgi:thiamine transport system substrate-binding protein|nr:thiamine ABC transporter substrate-binding protein [Treponemataceae bacterium]